MILPSGHRLDYVSTGEEWWLASDGRWYPPCALGGWPPEVKRISRLIAAAVVVAFGSVSAASSFLFLAFVIWLTCDSPGDCPTDDGATSGPVFIALVVTVCMVVFVGSCVSVRKLRRKRDRLIGHPSS